MPDKKKEQQGKQPKKPTDWELESPFDHVVTLEELISSPPFKEASDQSGMSHTAGTRIPAWLHRRIVYFTEMKGTPYQVQSDVTRDALYVGLRVLGMRYKANPEWAVEIKMAKAIEKVGLLRRVRGQARELCAGLEELAKDGDERQAVEGLEDFIGPVLELDDEWHKRKVVQALLESKVARDLLYKCSEEVRTVIQRIKKEVEHGDAE